MDAYEIQFFTLARVVSTGNYKNITEAIRKVEELPKKDNYIELIDKASLPFLITFHASTNPAAIAFIKEHRRLKSIEMNEEKQEIADNFYAALMKEFPPGQYIPMQNLHLVTMLLCISDPVLVKLGLRLLTDMDFTIDDYESVMIKVYAMRDQYPEAESLIRKYETLELQFDMVDEDLAEDEEDDMRVFEEEIPDGFDFQDEYEDDDDDIRNASFISNESGFESDSEELFMERQEEEQEQDQKLYNAIEEISAILLADSICSGNPQQIDYVIEVLSAIDLSHQIFQKHEITRLIYEYATPTEEALELWNHIEALSERSLENENRNVFKQIMKDAKRCSEISFPMMDLLVGYLMPGHNTPRAHQVMEVLLEKTVPLGFFQKHHVKKYLLECTGKTDAVMLLILKIRELEHAKGFF